MFRLIIADDEPRIRAGFTRIVNWEELGFRVVGCYADGSQVLEHLRREHADVVLTDIKMKQVGGLEVAQQIKAHHPNTVCVLVSAHQEFDFAHAAIAAGVKDYLFKPISSWHCEKSICRSCIIKGSVICGSPMAKNIT